MHEITVLHQFFNQNFRTVISFIFGKTKIEKWKYNFWDLATFSSQLCWACLGYAVQSWVWVEPSERLLDSVAKLELKECSLGFPQVFSASWREEILHKDKLSKLGNRRRDFIAYLTGQDRNILVKLMLLSNCEYIS